MTRLALAALALAAAAAPAAAQADPAVFLTGAVFAGVERVSHAEVVRPLRQSVDMSGTVVGGSAGIGTFVHPVWSVRFEFAVPGTLEEEVDQFVLGGIGFGPRSTSTLRTYSGSVLAAHHVPLGDRVSLALLGGVVIGQRVSRTVTENVIIFPPESPIPGVPFPLPLPPVRTETKTTTYHAGAGMGLDLDWALMDRIIITPQMRAHVLSGALSLRPGLGLRINF